MSMQRGEVSYEHGLMVETLNGFIKTEQVWVVVFNDPELEIAHQPHTKVPLRRIISVEIKETFPTREAAAAAVHRMS